MKYSVTKNVSLFGGFNVPSTSSEDIDVDIHIFTLLLHDKRFNFDLGRYDTLRWKLFFTL